MKPHLHENSMKLWKTFFWSILFPLRKIYDGGAACFPMSIWIFISFCIQFKMSVTFFLFHLHSNWCKELFLQNFKLRIFNLIFWKWFHIPTELLAKKFLKFLRLITLVFSIYFRSCLFKKKKNSIYKNLNFSFLLCQNL